MRQATMVQPGSIEFSDIPVPEPGPGQVRLRIHRIGVCGSDIHVNHGKHPFTSYPVVQGHEFSASIDALGDGVEGLVQGDKVTARPQVVCGTCDPCRRGDYHICNALKVEGFQAPGCAQDFFVTDADKVIRLPESFSYDQGALVEPVSVAVHAIGRVGGDLSGRRVAVLGAGPIGNLVAQTARSAGAEAVLITDLSDYRLDIARQCGIEQTSNAARESLAEAGARVFGDAGFDLAIECVGVQPTITGAVESIAKGGTILIVGVFGDKPTVDLALVQDRELSLVGTLMYREEDYQKAVDLIASGAIRTEPLITGHFPFDRYMDAYDHIDKQGDKALKIIIDVS